MFAKQNFVCAFKIFALYVTISAAWVLLTRNLSKHSDFLDTADILLFVAFNSIVLFLAVCSVARDFASFASQPRQHAEKHGQITYGD